MYKKERKTFFLIFDSSKICDNKIFRFFPEKRKITDKITVADEDKTVTSDNQLIPEELNQFFKNFTKSLNIRENSYLIDKSQTQ